MIKRLHTLMVKQLDNLLFTWFDLFMPDWLDEVMDDLLNASTVEYQPEQVIYAEHTRPVRSLLSSQTDLTGLEINKLFFDFNPN